MVTNVVRLITTTACVKSSAEDQKVLILSTVLRASAQLFIRRGAVTENILERRMTRGGAHGVYSTWKGSQNGGSI